MCNKTRTLTIKQFVNWLNIKDINTQNDTFNMAIHLLLGVYI